MRKMGFILILAVAASSLVLSNGFAQDFGEIDYLEEQQKILQPKSVPDVAVGVATVTYTLGRGDVVKIAVRNQPEFSGEFTVGPDGMLQYEFVGDVKAEGLSKDQLAEVLKEKLQRFVKNVEISVVIAAYRSKFVYILGEVGSPGKYPMKGNEVTLREVLIAAGLPTRAAALRRALIIRPAEVEPTPKRVDLYLLLYKGILKEDVVLAPGDLVVVPSTVPSEINRALTNILSPITRAAAVGALFTGGL